MDLETQVRVELARKVAASRLSIRRTARRLAFDEIEVARPVIEESCALTQSDLIDVIQQTSQDHLLAVTKRTDIGEKVSSALVARGADNILVSLLENASAKISRETYDRVAERAMSNPVLHAPFVRRQRVPLDLLDLLNAIYAKVSSELRREIIGKFQGAAPAKVEEAIEASREHLSTAYGALPRDYQLAKEYVDDLREARPAASFGPGGYAARQQAHIVPDCLLPPGRRRLRSCGPPAGGARHGRPGHYVPCIRLQTHALRHALHAGRGGRRQRSQESELYGELYEKVPVVAAQRAIRFWKIRAKTSESNMVAA